MGARPEDYAASAPYKSYIHVDNYEGAKELAEFLHQLDQDDQLYNEYFKWKVSLHLSLASRLETFPAGVEEEEAPFIYSRSLCDFSAKL